MPPPRHGDESESDDEVLVKRMKKIKQATKSRPKKMQVRSKKCAKANPKKKKEGVQKSPKSPVKSAQLLLFKHQTEHKSLKKETSATVMLKTPSLCNLCQNLQRETQNPKRSFKQERHHQGLLP